jgi:hypothetical protein
MHPREARNIATKPGKRNSTSVAKSVVSRLPIRQFAEGLAKIQPRIGLQVEMARQPVRVGRHHHPHDMIFARESRLIADSSRQTAKLLDQIGVISGAVANRRRTDRPRELSPSPISQGILAPVRSLEADLQQTPRTSPLACQQRRVRRRSRLAARQYRHRRQHRKRQGPGDQHAAGISVSIMWARYSS